MAISNEKIPIYWLIFGTCTPDARRNPTIAGATTAPIA